MRLSDNCLYLDLCHCHCSCICLCLCPPCLLMKFQTVWSSLFCSISPSHPHLHHCVPHTPHCALCPPPPPAGPIRGCVAASAGPCSGRASRPPSPRRWRRSTADARPRGDAPPTRRRPKPKRTPNKVRQHPLSPHVAVHFRHDDAFLLILIRACPPLFHSRIIHFQISL